MGVPQGSDPATSGGSRRGAVRVDAGLMLTDRREAGRRLAAPLEGPSAVLESRVGKGGRGKAMKVGDTVRIVSLCDDRELCDHELVGKQGTVAYIAFGADRWPIRVEFPDGQTREFEPEELEPA